MSLKNLPFKLATTSFIYPDRIIPNVIKLGSFFDEIELLIFESKPFIPNRHQMKGQGIKIEPIEVLPSSEDIQHLLDLSQSLDLTYNVHLPVDISLTDISKNARFSAIDTIKRVIELFAPLNPTTHTLHLEFNYDYNSNYNRSYNRNYYRNYTTNEEILFNYNANKLVNQKTNKLVNEKTNNHLHKWRESVSESLEILSSYLSDPSIISIETLDYPFEYVGDIVEACGMSVCIDAGHLIKYGYNIEELFSKYKERVPVIHLHGVDFASGIRSKIPKDHQSLDKIPKDYQTLDKIPKDHQSLDKTPKKLFTPTLNVLKDFKGVVSLEVFKYEHLCASLMFLNNFSE